MDRPALPPARRASFLLSAYLCGTHSGLLAPRSARRSFRRLATGVGSLAGRVAGACRAVRVGDRGEGNGTALGTEAWTPDRAAAGLRDALAGALDHPDVVDLVVFGSLARGGATGFSDADAILVITDEAAAHAASLRALRRRVLRAERAVLSYQPMQHHGFEVGTPTLLRDTRRALGLPAAALLEARSLRGSGLRVDGTGSLPDAAESSRRLRSVVEGVLDVAAWPGHPWEAHRLISMFELLPVLYLQARGRSVPKWASFDEAGKDFPATWWVYETLAEVRALWPRNPEPLLDGLARTMRNPWVAVAVWRRLPVAVPRPVRPLLTPPLLRALQSLATAMTEGVT